MPWERRFGWKKQGFRRKRDHFLLKGCWKEKNVFPIFFLGGYFRGSMYVCIFKQIYIYIYVYIYIFIIDMWYSSMYFLGTSPRRVGSKTRSVRWKNLREIPGHESIESVVRVLFRSSDSNQDMTILNIFNMAIYMLWKTHLLSSFILFLLNAERMGCKMNHDKPTGLGVSGNLLDALELIQPQVAQITITPAVKERLKPSPAKYHSGSCKPKIPLYTGYSSIRTEFQP